MKTERMLRRRGDVLRRMASAISDELHRIEIRLNKIDIRRRRKKP